MNISTLRITLKDWFGRRIVAVNFRNDCVIGIHIDSGAGCVIEVEIAIKIIDYTEGIVGTLFGGAIWGP